MKLYVLFAQRKGSYPGQYAPETLAIADEYGCEDNPEWITGAKVKHEQTGEFETLAIITLEVSESEVVKRLRPQLSPLPAEIISPLTP